MDGILDGQRGNDKGKHLSGWRDVNLRASVPTTADRTPRLLEMSVRLRSSRRPV